MCIIPYGTQLGEISFCAYNTGVGWRNIIEKMKANATVAEWNREHGKHAVYANDQELPLINAELTVRQHPLAEAERASGEVKLKRKPTSKKKKRRKRLPVLA
jgi:hypothetical protein